MLLVATTLLVITTQLVDDIGHAFCDSLRLPVGHFIVKIAELSCNPPLHGFPLPPTIHPYTRTYGIDKTI